MKIEDAREKLFWEVFTKHSTDEECRKFAVEAQAKLHTYFPSVLTIGTPISSSQQLDFLARRGIFDHDICRILKLL